MTRPPERRARRALAVASGLAALAWGLFLAWCHLAGTATALDRIENASADLRLRFAGPLPPPPGIVVVAIDDATIASAGAFPLPRAALAALVGALADAGARAVAIDLLLLEPGPPADDQALLAALARTRSVVAAAARFEGATDLARGAGPPAAAVVSWPAPPFGGAVLAALVNIAVDEGGTPRHVPLVVAIGDQLVPGFVLAAAALGSDGAPALDADGVTLGGRRQPLDLGHTLPLRPYGPAATMTTVSAADVLAGRVDAARLKGAIAVVGATALGSGDTFTTAFDDTVPGVEILATGIANLRDGTALRRDEAVRRIDAAAIVAMPVVIALAASLAGPALAALLAVLVVGGWILAAVVAFDAGVWLAVAAPLAAALPVAAATGMARRVIESRLAARLAAAHAALRALQSPMIAAKLAADPGFLSTPRAQDAAVLFLDLSGFTGLSERLGTERTRGFLDAFYRHVGSVSAETEGFFVAFLGDGALLVYGFPDPGDDARAAFRAIDRFDAVFGAWLATIPEAEGMTARYGLHFGPIVVSRLGEAGRQHITATGDTVNVASRLLEVAKQNRAHVAAGEAAFAAVDPAHRPAVAERFGAPTPVAIRGRHEPLAVRLRQR